MVSIRAFRPADTGGVLDLFETVFGEPRDREWFAWKYGENPYAEAPPIIVAEHDDEVVGARPFLALPMAVGSQRHLALQPADAMVHPDHRRKGVFTEMTNRALDRYEPSRFSFCFNFPNARTAPANKKLGWEKVGDLPTYYRIADPGEVATSHGSSRGLRAAASALGPFTSGYYAARDALSPNAADVTVRRNPGVPAAKLATIAQEHVPEEIHAVRDETFYEWRFRSPRWNYETYLIEDAVATGLIVGTPVGSGNFVKLIDVAPVGGPQTDGALAALLDAVLTDHADRSLFIAPEVSGSDATIRQFGFHADIAPPLARVATPTRHFTRPLSGDRMLNGLDITDQRNWTLTFAEQDTS